KCRGGRDRLGLVAMSLLRAQGARAALWLAEGTSARGADGNRRRIWRQGGISINDRGPCGIAGLEIRKARENYLRPRGRHGGYHQAAPFADAASHRGNS